jgi:hypothetical protein
VAYASVLYSAGPELKYSNNNKHNGGDDYISAVKGHTFLYLVEKYHAMKPQASTSSQKLAIYHYSRLFSINGFEYYSFKFQFSIILPSLP